MRSVDIHQHLWPEQFRAALARRTEPPRLDGATLVLREGRFQTDHGLSDLDVRLGLLDDDEIDTAVISLQPTLGIDDLAPEDRDLLLETWVDGIREVAARSGGRFLVFAPGRIEEGFAGASLAAGRLADLDAAAPLLTELERRSLPLFVHPGAAVPPPGAPPWWASVVDYTAQMHRAYFRWLAEGRDRWPALRVAFGILGGGAPFQLERLAQRGPNVRELLDPNVYLDTATYGRRAIELCAETFGVERLLYGSDRPVVDPGPTLRAVRGFGESVEKLLTIDNPQSFLG